VPVAYNQTLLPRVHRLHICEPLRWTNSTWPMTCSARRHRKKVS